MITRIISGGQTGADQAALDVAIEMYIAHGGWVPKGRKTEAGRLPDQYHVQEIDSISYPERTEMNVADSDATLIISHGKLTGGSAFTLDTAAKHGKPCFHIDLNELSYDKAVEVICSWIDARKIKILNVAGPRASNDLKIYEDTKNLLTMVIKKFFPKTVDEAVEILLDEMPLKDKAKVANAEEAALSGLHMSLGTVIRRRLGLWSGNESLMESCRKIAGLDNIHEDDASGIIIKELWKKLRESHSLRAIK